MRNYTQDRSEVLRNRRSSDTQIQQDKNFMKTRLRFLAVIYLFACLAVFLDSRPAVAETVVLTADEEKNWYRGNMHTHSLWSDGNDYLEMIALWYQEHDYNFLVFTDHNILADSDYWIQVKKSKGGAEAYGKLKVQFPRLVEERIADDGNLEVRLRKFVEVAKQFNDDGKFLLVQGEEISNFAGTTPREQRIRADSTDSWHRERSRSHPEECSICHRPA